MRVVRGVLATTHVDSHGEAFTREALEGMVTQAASAIVPLGIEHDPRIPPAGRIHSASIEIGLDGEASLVGEIEFFEPGDVPSAGGSRRLLLKVREDMVPCVTHDRSFASAARQPDLLGLRQLLGATGKTEAKKSVEPLGILTIACAIAGGAIAKGFFEAAGKDAWDGAKGALKRLFATRDRPGDQLLILEYSVPIYGHTRRIDVILSNPADNDIDALDAARLLPIETATTTAIRRDDSLVRLVFSFDSKAGPVLLYGVNDQAYPAYFAAPVPTLPNFLGLSPRGTINQV